MGRNAALRGTTSKALFSLSGYGGGVEGGTYLVQYIVERVRAVDGEANKDEIRLGVGEWSQTVILFLTCSVPQSQLHCLTGGWMHWVGNVVFKDGRDVFLCLC